MNYQLIAEASRLLGIELQYPQITLGTRYVDGFQDRTYWFACGVRVDEYRGDARVYAGSREFSIDL